MPYGSTSGVAALVPTLAVLDGETPDSYQVDQWLAQGAAYIDTHLSAAGYATPVSSTAAAYPELTAINELYAAAMGIRARGLDTMQGLTESRSDVWLREVRERLKDLTTMDLTAVGVQQTTTTAVKRQRLRSVQVRRIDGYSATVGEPTD